MCIFIRNRYFKNDQRPFRMQPAYRVIPIKTGLVKTMPIKLHCTHDETKHRARLTTHIEDSLELQVQGARLSAL